MVGLSRKHNKFNENNLNSSSSPLPSHSVRTFPVRHAALKEYEMIIFATTTIEFPISSALP